ncbi:hypothetical protein [Lewinella sp. IMCC34183]|uniref:hypothetical protein n=1 Tax=Lewinella sp. IMCC34183 TaxID=2248762 RepID=UPI000E245CDE|nr:hypothetical protein [Lewinella sp. IMCC34183]
MRFILLFTLFLPLRATVSAQAPFEGTIVYDFTFRDRTGQMTDEQARTFLGTEQTYRIRGGSYASQLDGLVGMTVVYQGGDSLFTYFLNAPQVLYNVVTVADDSLISYTIEEDVAEIAGVPCDLLTILSRAGTTRYYYSTDYPADARLFARHRFGWWSLCTELTGSLPLKTVTDLEHLYTEGTARIIRAEPVNDAAFAVPDRPRVAAPTE